MFSLWRLLLPKEKWPNWFCSKRTKSRNYLRKFSKFSCMNDPMMVDQSGIKLRQMCCVLLRHASNLVNLVRIHVSLKDWWMATDTKYEGPSPRHALWMKVGSNPILNAASFAFRLFWGWGLTWWGRKRKRDPRQPASLQPASLPRFRLRSVAT